MPIKVTKFTCKFKCGVKAMPTTKKMLRHEQQCTNNPLVKSCRTCANEIYEHDYDDNSHWFNRGCKLEVMNNFFEELYDEMKVGNGIHSKPIVHCPNWNSKEVATGTELFLENIKGKILSAWQAKIESSNLPF